MGLNPFLASTVYWSNKKVQVAEPNASPGNPNLKVETINVHEAYLSAERIKLAGCEVGVFYYPGLHDSPCD
jgi:hypothetical protein